MYKHAKGFTLVELMVTILILGILAAAGRSFYVNSSQKSKRTDVQSAMTTIAQKMESWKGIYYAYNTDGTTPQTSALLLSNFAIMGSPTGNYPVTGTALYTLSFTALTSTTWELTATPITGALMSGNGVIVLNSQGQRCWANGAATCPPTAITRWDGK